MSATPTVTFGLVEDSDEDFAAFSRVVAKDAPGTRLTRWPRAEALLESFDASGETAAPWPNILVVDLNLPGIDGCELVRRLRANPATRALPVFVLSGSARQIDIDRCYAAGANAYLTKPGSSAELRTLLQLLFRSLACFRAPSPLGAVPVEFDAVDERALEEHMVSYEDQLRAERDAERRGRERAEALQRISMRLANLMTAGQIESAFKGELVGGGVVDRAEFIPARPGSAAIDPFFTPQLIGDGMTGTIPVLAPTGTSLGQLRVDVPARLGDEEQSFLVDAAALAGQALDRVARAAHTVTRIARTRTDLPVQRWWNAAVERELRRARSTGGILTVVVVELDDFDRISLEHGAVEADRLLLRILDGWRQAGHDLLSRHGGEDYTALLPGVAHREARLLIAEVRRSAGGSVAFSTGVVQWDGREDAEQVMARAEAALAEERRLRALA
jgi:CheY-like chemotaxis protein/GGDEF domain-containing protein